MTRTKIYQFPQWALDQKKPGTELRFIGGHFYLYEVKSKYCKELKRSKKTTGKILGKVTQHGFVESKARVRERATNMGYPLPKLSIKEFGNVALLESLASDLIPALKSSFPLHWQEIFVLACCRLLRQFPLKKIELTYSSSFLSESYPQIACSAKSLSSILKEVGIQREQIVSFFKQFIDKDNTHLLIDVTSFVSKSQNLTINQKGYNNKRVYDPQINLLMIFSPQMKMPVYYRVLPGNIRDVVSFKLSLKETGIKDAIIIADKGFYSETNIESLASNGLKYILPLRRNSSLIDYSSFEKGGKKHLKGEFKYKEKRIWYDEREENGKRAIVYLNESLRIEEENDYLDRIESSPEEYTKEGFEEKEFRFGTLSILTNLGSSAEEIYKTYKARIEIEKVANVLKNTLEVDRSYMQNESNLEGWMFINHIALTLYYKIYNVLLKKELLTKYTPIDILDYLSTIKKIKINGNWELAEVPRKVKDITQLLDISIT